MAYKRLRLTATSDSNGGKGFKTVTLEERFTSVENAAKRIDVIKNSPYIGIATSGYTNAVGDYSSDNTSGFHPYTSSITNETDIKNRDKIKLESWNITEKLQVIEGTDGKPDTTPHVILKYTLKLDDFWTN